MYKVESGSERSGNRASDKGWVFNLDPPNWPKNANFQGHGVKFSVLTKQMNSSSLGPRLTTWIKVLPVVVRAHIHKTLLRQLSTMRLFTPQ